MSCTSAPSIVKCVGRLVGVDLSAVSLDDLDSLGPDLRTVDGWLTGLRARIAERRSELTRRTLDDLAVAADAARAAGDDPPLLGLGRTWDPATDHTLATRQRSRTTERDLARASTLRQLPPLGVSLEAGGVTADHVDAVTAAIRDLTPDQLSAVRDRVAELVSQAEAVAADLFARHLRAWIARVTFDDGLRTLARQRKATSLRVWTDRETGMVRLSGQFDPERGSILAHHLQTRLDVHKTAPVPDDCPTDPGARIDHLRALALIDLLDTSSSMSSDGDRPLGTVSGRTDMIIVVDHHTLTHRADRCAGGCADADGEGRRVINEAGPDGVPLPADTLRRHACTATLTLAVIDDDGVLLQLGRTTRLANRAQRRALRAMYPTCAIPGCTTPFDWCQIHHIDWWEHGGPTDIQNLVPVCVRHHHLVHDGGWTLRLDPTTRALTVTTPDGRATTHPPPRRRRPEGGDAIEEPALRDTG
jgi:hypothetical protein